MWETLAPLPVWKRWVWLTCALLMVPVLVVVGHVLVMLPYAVFWTVVALVLQGLGL